MTTQYKAVLFDLDGTLVDTALDFTLALNTLLKEENRPTLSLNVVRNDVSYGALAMIKRAFSDISEENEQIIMRSRMIAHYESIISVHSRCFPGIKSLLKDLHQRHVPWGIVTNKPEGLAKKLISELNLGAYAPNSIVGGDTLPFAKPHPAPMKLAATQCRADPEQCIYIGDHIRDVEAARAAGMFAIAASYGYLSVEDNPHDWGADIVIDTPHTLQKWLSNNI